MSDNDGAQSRRLIFASDAMKLYVDRDGTHPVLGVKAESGVPPLIVELPGGTPDGNTVCVFCGVRRKEITLSIKVGRESEPRLAVQFDPSRDIGGGLVFIQDDSPSEQTS